MVIPSSRPMFIIFLSVLLCMRIGHSCADEVEIEEAWPTRHSFSSDTSLFSSLFSKNVQRLSESQSEEYTEYMEGCYKSFSKAACDENERDRIEMNTKQPPLQRNFTQAGYAKSKAPTSVIAELSRILKENETSEPKREHWHAANIHTNHWKVPTMKMDIAFTNRIVRPVQTVLEQWCGEQLIPSSFYGIRQYLNGSVLAPHVDRIPLVISAIINIGQDVEEDWVLQLVPHSGVPVNITLAPFEMLLYESHSVIHGRPYPLRGQFYSNIFLHFEPTGHSSHHFPHDEPSKRQALWYKALQQNTPGKKRMPKKALPSYIQPDTLEATRWFQKFSFQRKTWTKAPDVAAIKAANVKANKIKPPDAHRMASRGDLNSLKILAQQDPTAMAKTDHNGWAPIHEAARTGQTAVLEFLLERHDVDVNQRTGKGGGGSPLYWAEMELPKDHEAIRFLKEKGAKSIPPNK